MAPAATGFFFFRRYPALALGTLVPGARCEPRGLLSVGGLNDAVQMRLNPERNSEDQVAEADAMVRKMTPDLVFSEESGRRIACDFKTYSMSGTRSNY